jgi:SAM-dependent methyltransferase
MAHRFFTRIRIYWRKRFGVLPLSESLRSLNAWFLTPLGKRILSCEKALVDEEIVNIFGYHLLQLSVVDSVDLTGASRILHKFALYPLPVCSPLVRARADFHHLPLPPDSVDVVLLHHALDYSQSPHQVLREASSVLVSRGHILIVGFNPWSLLGLWRWVARLFSRGVHWRHQSLRLGRLLDWLTILDMEPIVIKQGFYTGYSGRNEDNPFLQWVERWSKKLGLPCGGVYLIVARKVTFAKIPMKPQWQGYAGFRGWGVIKILGKATRDTVPVDLSKVRTHKYD